MLTFSKKWNICAKKIKKFLLIYFLFNTLQGLIVKEKNLRPHNFNTFYWKKANSYFQFNDQKLALMRFKSLKLSFNFFLLFNNFHLNLYSHDWAYLTWLVQFCTKIKIIKYFCWINKKKVFKIDFCLMSQNIKICSRQVFYSFFFSLKFFEINSDKKIECEKERNCRFLRLYIVYLGIAMNNVT